MTLPIKLSLFPNKKVLALDVLSLVLWIYAFLKLFVVDVDRYALNIVAPNFLWILDFRLVGVALIVLIGLLALRPSGAVVTFLYVVLFPIILLVWKIPLVIVRMGSWVSRISAISIFISAFTEIKYRLAYFVFYSVSVLLILSVGGVWSSIAGAAGLLLCLTTSYVKTFVGAFKAPKVLTLYRSIFDWIQRDDASVSSPARVSQPLSTLPEATSTELVQKLQNSVFVNRVCVFFSNKLRDYNKSEIHILSGVFSILVLSLITLATFSILYKAAFTIDNSSIEVGSGLSAFDFIYIAFDNMFFGTNSSSQLFTVWSQSLSMYQRVLSTALIVIFTTIFLEIKKRRHTQEIEEAIIAAEAAAKRVESKVVAEYPYGNIQEAIDDLSRIESSLYVAVMKLMASFRFR